MYTPVRDLIGLRVVVQPNPRGVVLWYKTIELPLINMPLPEQLMNYLAMLHQHVPCRHLEFKVRMDYYTPRPETTQNVTARIGFTWLFFSFCPRQTLFPCPPLLSFPRTHQRMTGEGRFPCNVHHVILWYLTVTVTLSEGKAGLSDLHIKKRRTKIKAPIYVLRVMLYKGNNSK